MVMVSVIIPAYNSEKYISQCIESVSHQSYNELEIIIVYDESIDSTLEICKNWAEKDTRIVLICNKDRKGLGEARNIGVRNATGKYITFLDSDDWYEESFIGVLVKKMEADEEISVAGMPQFRILEESGESIRKPFIPFGTYQTDQEKDALFFFGPHCVWVWMFRREWLLASKIFHPKTLYYEDWGIKPLWVFMAKKILYVEGTGVNYRMDRPGSLSRDSQTGIIRALWEVIDYSVDILHKKQLFNSHKTALYKQFLYEIDNRHNKIPEEDSTAIALLDKLLQNKEGIFMPKKPSKSEIIVFGGFSSRWIAQRSICFGNSRRHYCFSSLISAMTLGNEPEIQIEDSFRKEQIFQDYRGDFCKYLSEVKEDIILILDCLSVRYDLLQNKNGNIVTCSEAWDSYFIKSESNLKIIRSGTKEYVELWKQSCVTLAKMIHDMKAKLRVELIQSRLAEQYGNMDTKYSYNDIENIRKQNQFISECEDILWKTLQSYNIDTRKRKFEKKWCFTDENFKYGKEPQYMNECLYTIIGNELFEYYMWGDVKNEL